MEQHNDNSDKTTFKVEFLGEYHDVVIDWNDDKYLCKGKQLFELLASITGVPRELNLGILLYQAENRRPPYHDIWSLDNSDYPNKEMICDSIRDAEGRFRLTFGASYDFKLPLIFYALVPESLVPEGGCSFFFCRYKQTKSFFNKVKDIITKEKLNAKIMAAIKSSRDYSNEVLRQFNVLQYFRSICDYHYTRRNVIELQNRVPGGKHCYLRTRG